ncbi:MAG: 30S ribosomal protein S6 [Rhodospirillales bacterium]|nr:30S ribosomal protein S6 [Rhodospirillales bacterium]
MALYESVFIARQDVSAPQVEAITDGFAALIEENGGKVAKREYWGLKNLSYRIKKNRKGHYMLFNLDAPSEAVQEMERQMRLHEDILRYLTLRLDEIDDEPSIQMQNRNRDESRRRDGDRRDGDRRDGDRRDDRGDRRDEKPAAEAAPPEPKEEAKEEAAPAEAPAEEAASEAPGEAPGEAADEGEDK